MASAIAMNCRENNGRQSSNHIAEFTFVFNKNTARDGAILWHANTAARSS
jgi:hypothetical protein